MDLKNINYNPKLTSYLVENKLIDLTVIDVGARGGFANYWALYKDCIKLIGFEPGEEREGCLKCALGDGKDKTFYITRYPSSCSFYPPNTDFCERLQNKYFLNVMDTKEIPTVTLDSLNLKPDFIKLDTEGSELDILCNGLQTLKTCLGVSVEFEFRELFKRQHLFEDVHKFLKEQGFQIYDLNTSRLQRLADNSPYEMSSNKGQLISGQGLYFRDIYPEKNLKLASLMELFDLRDCAFEICPDEYRSKL